MRKVARSDISPPVAKPAAPSGALWAGAGPMTAVELREHLVRLGLTQTELAQLLGANARTVRRWADEGGAQAGPGIPGTVANCLRAWRRLQRAALAWRPQDVALLAAQAAPALAASCFDALRVDAMLHRVHARGGPAVPWDVDLARQRATVGTMRLTFCLLEDGGFVPLSYQRQGAPSADPVRDETLLEDGVACVARALERHGHAASPSLRIGPAAVVGGNTLVFWEQRSIPTIAVILPLNVARAVLGPRATVQELSERVERHRAALSTLALALADEGAGAINELGVRELRLNEELLQLAMSSGQGRQRGEGVNEGATATPTATGWPAT